MLRRDLLRAAALPVVSAGCASLPSASGYDLIVRGGEVFDGLGGDSRQADVAILGDRIAAIGDLRNARGREEINASGLAVAPGFINVLSQASESLLVDGRSQSDIRQGVTLELLGEGASMGPLTPEMREQQISEQGDLRYDVPWSTLGEYLDHAQSLGISCNLASVVGAHNIRVCELGWNDVRPTPAQLARMQDRVREAMREGAIGVGSALIYPPGSFAGTDELVALVSAAHEFGGGYLSHMRSEGERYLEAIDELVDIGRRSGGWGHMYHMKPAGASNWPKSQAGHARLNAARASGIAATQCIYPYTAGATGLSASMPPWVQEGGAEAWFARLRQPQTRARVIAEMRAPNGWDSALAAAGGPENVLLLAFQTDALKPLVGRRLSDVARERGVSAEDAIIDLILEDRTRVEVAYFVMSEDNIRRNIASPWTMVGSDGASVAPEGVFLQSSQHPRSYGSFARFLGKYVREERVISLAEAIRRLTSLPATTFSLSDRGRLARGAMADVVVFDPARIQDHATYDRPQQYSTGVSHVIVNGAFVLRDGEHTNARPGRVVRGPGWLQN